MATTNMEVDGPDTTDDNGDGMFELAAAFTFGEAGVRVAGVLEGTPSQLVLGDQVGGMASFDWTSPSRELTLLPPHNHAVTALLPSDDGRLYVTGCKDSCIRIYSSAQHELVKELAGHDKPVTSLAWARAAVADDASAAPSRLYLVSGSWDGTARLWCMETHALAATLPDHENSVCVAGLGPSSGAPAGSVRVATGSAGIAVDGTIRHHALRLWTIHPRTGQVRLDRRIEHDHDGPIRGLCAWGVDGAQSSATAALASCSNDGTVKVRDAATGQALSTLTCVQDDPQQHPPMLLNATALSDPRTTYLAAGAEDGQVIIWDLSGARSPQVLRHAACVWSVVALPNGDLGTCCQDGHFYVFTRDPTRQADSSVREAWAESARAARSRLHQGPSSDEVAKLPQWHRSSEVRGRSEGQVQLFQRDGSAVAAQWSAVSQTWIEVGQVVGSSNDQGLLDGVRYDHVLPIQVDAPSGGVHNLQIGYNDGENPFVAAQRFIDAHVLPQYHLAEIADYITQRVGGAASRTLGGTVAGPGGGAAPRALAPPPAATAGVPLASYDHLPAKAYLTFPLTEKTAASTFEKMKAKVESFQRLSTGQLETLSRLMETLGAISRYPSSKVSDDELQLVAHMLQDWSLSHCFPALDLARMAALHPDAASTVRAPFWTNLLNAVAALQERLRDSPESDVDATARGAIPLLSLRLLANALGDQCPGPREAVSARLEEVIRFAAEQLRSAQASGGKALRLAVATVLHNLCRYLHSQPATAGLAPPEVVTETVALCREVLSRRDFEGDAVYRTLVALGTLVLSPNSSGPLAKEAARNLFLASAVEPAASPHGPSAKAAAKEVYAALA